MTRFRFDIVAALLPLITLGFMAFAGPARAVEKQELVVVTSYPPSFFEPFRAAFERANADMRVTIVQRNTASASRFVIEKADVPADIFWASAADAFELLKRNGSLRPIAPRNTGAADRIFGYPVNDPEGYYLGFALSGYGFVYNPAHLAKNNLPAPRNWQDLLNPVYSGQIGITTPSRSGTTHLIVEALLQTYGWEEGWAMLSKLGGNLSTVTARSFGVASGVAQRRFSIGVTIDFLATTPDFASAGNVFVLPPDTVFVPASIAILSRARNVPAAERFVDFVLSEPGQKLLLSPAIARIPVDPALNRGLLPREDGERLLKSGGFDAALSARRYGLVNLIFDDYIVRRRATLARLWKRVAELETMEIKDAQRLSMLARARRLLATPPLSASEIANVAAPLQGEWPRGVARSAAHTELASRLRARIEQNLAEAEGLLSSASRPGGSINLHPWRQ
ncbi:ABC transporter substrate-binding protein [Ensifer adhaerens]|uniref:ABC transporter substrate-binding protein n=1 Tax=Ensifer adhaerens TaxID=106592 RepID=UPI0015C38F1F|nr:extracellular solute-binding protein [Ensifer adhaerens]